MSLESVDYIPISQRNFTSFVLRLGDYPLTQQAAREFALRDPRLVLVDKSSRLLQNRQFLDGSFIVPLPIHSHRYTLGFRTIDTGPTQHLTGVIGVSEVPFETVRTQGLPMPLLHTRFSEYECWVTDRLHEDRRSGTNRVVTRARLYENNQLNDWVKSFDRHLHESLARVAALNTIDIQFPVLGES